jgi:hypothetical protein
MEFTALNESDDWVRYPTNKVVGSLSNTEDLNAAITDLNASGFGQEEIYVVCGRKAASQMDVTGERHGLLGRFFRAMEEFADMDLKLLEDYKEELLGGHFLVGVDVDDEDERKRAANILVAHGGHRVNFFGLWSIQNLG